MLLQLHGIQRTWSELWRLSVVVRQRFSEQQWTMAYPRVRCMVDASEKGLSWAEATPPPGLKMLWRRLLKLLGQYINNYYTANIYLVKYIFILCIYFLLLITLVPYVLLYLNILVFTIVWKLLVGERLFMIANLLEISNSSSFLIKKQTFSTGIDKFLLYSGVSLLLIVHFSENQSPSYSKNIWLFKVSYS